MNDNGLLKVYLEQKGLTSEEYKILGKDLADDYIEFNENLADKYNNEDITRNGTTETEKLIQFARNEFLKDDEKVTYPKILLKDRNVSLVKYYDGENTHYSVDFSNFSVGVSICFSNNLLEVKNIYEKEVLFNQIQMTDDKNLYAINGINSIFGAGLQKALISDESIIGRRSTVIDYFNNELEHINEYFSEDEVEQKEDWKNGINEILTELKSSKNTLEPVVLFIHPMDGYYHIENEEEQKESLKEELQKIVENIEENKDKSIRQLQKINAKEDIRKLDKLYTKILNMNFEDKNVPIMQDKVTSLINLEISRVMKENNISYEEYKELCKINELENKEERHLKNLGEQKLQDIFEALSVKEICEVLTNSYDYKKEEVMGLFADEDQIQQANEYFEQIEKNEEVEDEI